MSLEEHLSKFPEQITNERWSKIARQQEHLYRILLWKEEHEKLFKAKVSQIQDLNVKVKKANVISDFELGYTSALSKVIEVLVSPSGDQKE